MKYCKNCIMPDTRPNLSLDEDGVCAACRVAKQEEQIDWSARKTELGTILEKYRNKDGTNYDCIVPVSGGKDSAFQTYVIKRVFGLNPLCVTWAPCKSTDLGKKNLQNLLESLQLDHIYFTPNPVVYRRLFKLGFEKLGDPCWPCHVGIFTYPVRVAVKYKIPLIIWAENPYRDTETLGRKWLYTFGGLLGKSPEDWVEEGLSLSDLQPYIYPSDDEINSVGVTGLFLGQYIKWDAKAQVEIVTKECGFRTKEDGPVTGGYLSYENLDCGFTDIHDYLMYLKYGFGRATTQVCIDIWNGRMTRDEAFKLAQKYDGKVEHVKEFCDFIGITEKEFWEIAESFRGKDAWMKEAGGRWVKRV